MEKPKYSLHLFAGGGGGILADLLDWITPVCAVEIMEYQRTILGLRFPGLPLCAAVAFVFGFEILRVIVEGRKDA